MQTGEKKVSVGLCRTQELFSSYSATPHFYNCSKATVGERIKLNGFFPSLVVFLAYAALVEDFVS